MTVPFLVLAMLVAEPSKEFDIRDPEGGVVIPADKIVAYDWETHTLTLKPGTRKAVHTAVFGKRPVSTFVVAVGGKEVYRGTWKSVIHSSSSSTPVIVLDDQSLHPAMPEDQVRIDLGYPAKTFFKGEDPRGNPAIKEAVKGKPALASDDPLTIAASNVGAFAKGKSWHLSVNSAGKAELTVGGVRREFDVPKTDVAALRKALADESFFDLAEEYGERVPGGNTQTLTIAAGDRVRTVRVRFLMNWVSAKDKDKLREPARAVRLLVLVRGWINDERAVDLREYDQAVLDAVK